MFNAKDGQNMSSMFGSMTSRAQVPEVPDAGFSGKKGKPTLGEYLSK